MSPFRSGGVMATDRPRVLVVDDHEVVAAGLTALLSPKYEVVGPVRDGGKVLDAVKQLRPDAVLLDLSLPTISGMELLPQIRKDHHDLPVVVLTGSAEYLTGRAALVLGALGFLPKDSGIDELDLALRTALQGKQYLSPRVPPPPSWSHPSPLPGRLQRLTPRQFTILKAMGTGRTREDLATEFGVSLHTMNFHLRNLRALLGVETDAELVLAAQFFHLKRESGT